MENWLKLYLIVVINDYAIDYRKLAVATFVKV